MSERRLSGTGATPRSGAGAALWYRPDDRAGLGDPPDPADVDPVTERERFAEASETARDELDRERERAAERVGEEEAAVFDAHVQFLEDPQIETGVHDAIDDGLPAEHAVRRAFEDPIDQFAAMEGTMAERADDLRDVRDRLVRLLTGGERTNLGDLPPGTVLLAERLTPSDTAQLDPDAVAGIATVEGGRTSHAAIIARSLGIPAVVGVGEELLDVANGETVVVDGESGVLVRDPPEETVSGTDTEDAAPVRREPVTTTDDRAVEVAANVGTIAEAAPAAERGADGVGLLRTEFLFLGRESPPDEDEQYEAYRDVCEAFGGARVVVRTLDVGGDKPVPYMDLDPIENGFLGSRGIRLSLDEHADLFETQLRALLRVSGTDVGERLAAMFPMVATVDELEAALKVVETVADDLADEDLTYAVPELGVMVETPAATLLAESLAERVDFLSIGTNDLTQYVMAARRDVERVAPLHDPLHPAVLRAVDRTIRAGHRGDARVGMCGEMAGDPASTELLVGLGLDELSMSAVTIPDVKARVAETDAEAAETLVERALAAETRAEVRALLE